MYKPMFPECPKLHEKLEGIVYKETKRRKKLGFGSPKKVNLYFTLAPRNNLASPQFEENNASISFNVFNICCCIPLFAEMYRSRIDIITQWMNDVNFLADNFLSDNVLVGLLMQEDFAKNLLDTSRSEEKSRRVSFETPEIRYDLTRMADYCVELPDIVYKRIVRHELGHYDTKEDLLEIYQFRKTCIGAITDSECRQVSVNNLFQMFFCEYMKIFARILPKSEAVAKYHEFLDETDWENIEDKTRTSLNTGYFKSFVFEDLLAFFKSVMIQFDWETKTYLNKVMFDQAQHTERLHDPNIRFFLDIADFVKNGLLEGIQLGIQYAKTYFKKKLAWRTS